MVKTKIPVRDAMTSQVITITTDKNLEDAAKLMAKHDIGGLVVTDNDGPVGMITERDFVDVVAGNKIPSELSVETVMSKPLVTISPDQGLFEAAKLMVKSKVRKLPVKSKDILVGIITAEDIVKVAPREIELLLELAALKAEPQMDEFVQSPTAGNCEVCSNYSDNLVEAGSSYVCPECKEAMQEED